MHLVLQLALGGKGFQHGNRPAVGLWLDFLQVENRVARA
jgi:hypothetical protein